MPGRDRRDAQRCVFETDIRLVPLFARSFPDIEVVSYDEPADPRATDPTHDFQTPIGSLPRWCRRGLESPAEKELSGISHLCFLCCG